ncbi:MAG: GNAT family N-acetyltransferase [Oscillospiraceae bacterium]|nr:GNAT family N-acetyltransferase [Oscillospiraceae bacterium]
MKEKMQLYHVPIDLNRGSDKDYVLERHCRINYACDSPWATAIPYETYRAAWFKNAGQQAALVSALADSRKDPRTIADIVYADGDEPVGYLWAPFHGEDPAFVWAGVEDIYVEEEYRRKGIAAALMTYAEDKARQNGAKVIRSGTGCQNIPSQAMHQKAGYKMYRVEYEKVLADAGQTPVKKIE